MYRKSFFIILLAFIVMGLSFTGAKYLATIPGFMGLPSSYDPHISMQKAFQTSKEPLLIEFYSDTCGRCKYETPFVYKASQKFKDKLTFVMVDVNDPKQSQVADIFGITYIPDLYIFDFKHMIKASVPTDETIQLPDLDKSIGDTLAKVQKEGIGKAPINLKAMSM